ncbi:virulence factor TspB C-terminal domain-related protein, partial [Acinetobacter qingfengensis]
VNSSISDSATSKTTGGKVFGKASTTAATDAAKAGSTLAKRLEKLRKGNVALMVGQAALQALIEGIGWVMDEGGKVTKTDDSNISKCGVTGAGCAYASTIYQLQGNSINTAMGYFPTAQDACKYYTNYYSLKYIGIGSSGSCQYSTTGGTTANAETAIYDFTNLYYSSTAEQPTVSAVEVNTDELASKISDYVGSNNNDLSQQLIQDAYTHDNNFGINDAENQLSTEQGNKLVDALQNAAKSENGTYTSSDGQTTASVQPAGTASTSTGEATTTNPDGTTSSTTTEQTTEWPAVCDYASFLCEWWQWTQEKYDEFTKEPEDEDTQLDIDDQNQVDIDTNINFGGQCPAPIVLIDSQILGIAWYWQYDFTDFCTILTSYVRPILIALGAFIAALIIGGVKINE